MMYLQHNKAVIAQSFFKSVSWSVSFSSLDPDIWIQLTYKQSCLKLQSAWNCKLTFFRVPNSSPPSPCQGYEYIFVWIKIWCYWPVGDTPPVAPKKRKMAILSFGRSGQLQVLRNESAVSDVEPWQKYLLPNAHSKKLRFFNSIVQQIYESAFRHKQSGFRNYLLEQQQTRWALNNKIEELSNKANNLLKNERYGVCQNIKKFISGTNNCNSSDVAKCESCLSTVNDTLNSASDLRSRKELFSEDQTLKSFAGDELAYLEAQVTQALW